MQTTNGTSAQLEVCRDCLELRGPLFEAANALVQRCRCESRGSLREKRWRGFDFNMAFELCYLCAAEVIPTGSRWSGFYCAHCELRVKRHNHTAGSAVIPQGRHALMGDERSGDERPSRPSAELVGEGSRIDRIRAWRRERVRAIFHGLTGTAVPLARYLARARAVAVPELTELFDEPASRWGSAPNPDERAASAPRYMRWGSAPNPDERAASAPRYMRWGSAPNPDERAASAPRYMRWGSAPNPDERAASAPRSLATFSSRRA